MCCRADLSLPYLELGKPDAGKPPVRFDEGWGADGHWPCASQSVAPCLLYTPTRSRARGAVSRETAPVVRASARPARGLTRTHPGLGPAGRFQFASLGVPP